jgi:hypothetical protein
MACHELIAIIDQSVAMVTEIPSCFSVQILQQQQQQQWVVMLKTIYTTGSPYPKGCFHCEGAIFC